MSKPNQIYFRVHTMNLLNEIADCGLNRGMGLLQTPLNVLRGHLCMLAKRCTELNDPVLDRIMFDMALYELPNPTSQAYGKLMYKVYKKEKDFLNPKSNAKAKSRK